MTVRGRTRGATALLAVVLALLVMVAPVAATHIVTGSDGFEDGDLDGWSTRPALSSDPTPSIQTTATAADGSTALNLTGAKWSMAEWSEPGDATNDLAVHNMTVSARLRERPGATGGTGLTFAAGGDRHRSAAI